VVNKRDLEENIADFKESYTDICMERLFVFRCRPGKVIGQIYFLLPKNA
jgi:hypothetical protein